MKRSSRDYEEPEDALAGGSYDDDVDTNDSYDVGEFASLEEYKELLKSQKQKVEEKRPAINNTEALLSKLEEIELPKEWPWIEKLEVLTQQPVDIEDPEDDLKREASFYASAMTATKQALQQLEQYNIPYKRPLDFYAETVKPDSHMAKVKQVLLNEQRKIAEVEERKKLKSLRKFSKEAEVQKKRERSKQKRDALEAIEDMKHKSKYKHNQPSSQAIKRAVRKGTFKRMRMEGDRKSK